MKLRIHLFLPTVVVTLGLFHPLAADDAPDGPLPKFTYRGVALHPDDLEFVPTDELERSSIIEMEGRIPEPLGRYYLYYSPHKHAGIGLAYSDSIEGPWTEYEGNPLVESTAIPDIRWFEETGKFHLWGHRKNARTEMWTSEDGIHFEYDSVSIDASEIGTRNATYTRTYEFPLERHGSKYIMLYSGFIEERGIRCVWLAHSNDGADWTQETTPLVEPIEGEGNDLYCPSLFQWEGRNYIVYADHSGYRGGLLKYVEMDDQLRPVGRGGERFVLIDQVPDSPIDNRYRGGEFHREGDTIHLYSGASVKPRLIVYATAEVGPEVSKEKVKKSKEKSAKSSAESVSLDEILEGWELETVYETSFEEPLQMIREDELIEDGKFVREPPRDIDWVFEGPGEVSVQSGRLHIKNDPSGNCVLWNTREFPESFVAEWDFEHLHPQGLAILFFAAHGIDGGSIFTPGLPRRGGNFGNYTKGKILSYHTSYTATDEEGVPRGSAHLKKNHGGLEGHGNKLTGGPGTIDGKTGEQHKIRLAKLENRIVLEINGEVSFDYTDDGEKGRPYYGAGQIGFRQMRHAIEASYGGLKVSQAKPKTTSR